MERFLTWFKRESLMVPASPFSPIISAALKSRGQRPDDMKMDALHRQPKYVVRMCQTLHGQLVRAGNRTATLDDIMRVERSCCGHSNYQSKLELRLRHMLNVG